MMTIKENWQVVAIVVWIGFVCGSEFHNKYCEIPCDFGSSQVSHTVCKREESKCGPDPKCGPNFQEIRLSDDDRQYILDIHNYLRNKVALGYEKRGKQPLAANMNALSYNMELEFIAQCWANTCNGNPLVHDLCRRTSKHSHVGQNLGFINSSYAEIDTVSSIKELILAWYDEVEYFNSSWVNDTQQRKFQVGHYTQLVWAETSEIGCAIAYYTTTTAEEKIWHHIVLVCNYGLGGNYLGRSVYKVGKPSSKCPNGRANKKYRGLCGKIKSLREINKNFDTIFGRSR